MKALTPQDPRTAPKDGTPFIAMNAFGTLFNVCWDASAGEWNVDAHTIAPQFFGNVFACWFPKPFNEDEAMAVWHQFDWEADE